MNPLPTLNPAVHLGPFNQCAYTQARTACGLGGLCVLSGPPGSGKSALLRAAARDAGLDALHLPWSDPEHARALVRQARRIGRRPAFLVDIAAGPREAQAVAGAVALHRSLNANTRKAERSPLLAASSSHHGLCDAWLAVPLLAWGCIVSPSTADALGAARAMLAARPGLGLAPWAKIAAHALVFGYCLGLQEQPPALWPGELDARCHRLADPGAKASQLLTLRCAAIAEHGADPALAFSRHRNHRAVVARAAAWLAAHDAGLSYPEIAALEGRGAHSTILSAAHRAQTTRDTRQRESLAKLFRPTPAAPSKPGIAEPSRSLASRPAPAPGVLSHA